MIKETISCEGIKRTFLLHVPPSYDPQKPVPILLVFHGENQNANDMARLAHFHEFADKYGFLLVYTQGVKDRWNDGRRTDWHRYDDVAYTEHLLTFLERKWGAAREVVFAAGFSEGGFFVQHLALKLQPGRLVAIASVAGTLSQVTYHKMRLKGNVSVLFILGMDDKVVPFQGGPINPGKHGYNEGIAVSASEAVNFWVKNNKCRSDCTDESYPDVDREDGTNVKVARYMNCPNGTEVTIFGIQGGGHAWPGPIHQSTKGGKTCRDFDATDLIFQFFTKHGLATPR